MRWMGQVRGGVTRAWRMGLAQKVTPGGLWKTAAHLRAEGPRVGLLLQFQADHDAHRIAIAQGDQVLSYFEMLEEVRGSGPGGSGEPHAPGGEGAWVEHRPEGLIRCLALASTAPGRAALEPLAAIASFVAPGDRLHVAGAPLQHVASRGLALGSILLGKTVALAKPDAAALIAELEHRRATTAFVERSVLDEMARLVAAASPRPDLSSLSTLITEGPERAELARAVFGDRVLELSGSLLGSVERLGELHHASRGER